jgi:hypothetical protein
VGVEGERLVEAPLFHNRLEEAFLVAPLAKPALTA